MPSSELYSVVGDFDVRLMQPDICHAHSKCYIIQVLERAGMFSCWTRWSRLGEVGTYNLSPPGSQAEAVKMFEKKFKDKTKNAWAMKDAFVKHDGKYQLVVTDSRLQ